VADVGDARISAQRRPACCQQTKTDDREHGWIGTANPTQDGKRPVNLGSMRSRNKSDATKGAGIPKPAATNHISADEGLERDHRLGRLARWS
jgi:hypothetical protein